MYAICRYCHGVEFNRIPSLSWWAVIFYGKQKKDRDSPLSLRNGAVFTPPIAILKREIEENTSMLLVVSKVAKKN